LEPIFAADHPEQTHLGEQQWSSEEQSGKSEALEHWSSPPSKTAKSEGMMATMGLLLAALMGGIVRAWSPGLRSPVHESRRSTTAARVGWCRTTRYRFVILPVAAGVCLRG